MTKQEADFIGSMNMCDEISNEAYKKIMCKVEEEECEDCISRQVVKDMLTAEWTKYMPMELDINLSFVLDKISALPSVTPSYNSVKTELKPCGDCVSRTDVLKVMCEKCPVYDCITGCQSYRSIENMPPVTPKAESGEISVLDKIRAEIEQNAYPIVGKFNNIEKGMTLYGILQVIDKYKAESEDKE